MQIHARRTLFLLALIVVVGCAQPNVRVQTTPGIDFTKYRTYAIKPGNVVYPGAPEERREEIARRIQDAVAIELESRGLTPQPEQPDVVVTYTASAKVQETSGSQTRAPTGVNIRESGANPYDEPGAVRALESPDAANDQEFRGRYVQGNLVIDLLDGKSRRLAWRAMSHVELESDKRGRLIEQVVTKAFKELPLGVRGVAQPATTQP